MNSLICTVAVSKTGSGTRSCEEAHHSVELAILVALRPTVLVFGLAGAELTEVLSSTWYYIVEQLHFDAAERLTWAMSASACLGDGLNILFLFDGREENLGVKQGTTLS